MQEIPFRFFFKKGSVCVGFWLFLIYTTTAVITYWNRLLREVVKFPPWERVAQKPSGNGADPAVADLAFSSWVG